MAAVRQSTISRNDQLSFDDYNKLNNTFKSKEFNKLLKEFSDDINDPKNEKQCELQVIQYEKDRGEDLLFLNSKPGLVLSEDIELAEVEEFLQPKYKIKHINNIDLQDFTVIQGNEVINTRPKYLGIQVELPGVTRAVDLDIEVLGQRLKLVTVNERLYKLDVPLPYLVDETPGEAKFDVSTGILNLKFAVLSNNLKDCGAIPHSPSNSDSGIECDLGFRTNSVNECSVAEDIDDGEVQTSLIDIKEPFHNGIQNKEITLLVPPSYVVYETEIQVIVTVICNVGNVTSESVSVQLVGTNQVEMKFSSVGGGLTLLCYGLVLKSCDDLHKLNSTEYIFGSNKLMFFFEKKSKAENLWKTCFIGALNNLELISIKLIGDKEQLNDQNEMSFEVKNSRPASQLNNSKPKDEEDKNEDEGIEMPPPSLICYPIGRQIRARTVSESSSNKVSLGRTTSWPRGILKRRARSLSESNLVTFPGWSSLGSSIDLDDVLEDEEDTSTCDNSVQSLSLKKSVRFNDVIKSQVFRANSSILGQRAKNQRKAAKKKASLERRLSESDSQGHLEVENGILQWTSDGEEEEEESTDVANENSSFDSLKSKKELNVEISEEKCDGELNTINGEGTISSSDIKHDKNAKNKNKIKNKNKNQRKRNNKKTIEFSNNLIFQLDMDM